MKIPDYTLTVHCPGCGAELEIISGLYVCVPCDPNLVYQVFIREPGIERESDLVHQRKINAWIERKTTDAASGVGTP